MSDYSPVLVTGGAGFIGSHLVDALLEQGRPVVVVDDLSSGRRENLPAGITFHQLDVCSPELARVFENERPAAVFHLAAQIDVRRAVERPDLDAKINVLGSINLLELCRRHRIGRVIFTSTGGAIYGEPEYLPADEGHPVNAASPYGIDKATVDQYLRYYHQVHGMSYCSLRLANVYGPRQDPHGEAGVVAIFSAAMLQGRAPRIYGDGEQVRDFVYVSDVVSAQLLALEIETNCPINIGTGLGTSVNQLYRCLAGLTGFKHKPLYCPPRAGEVRAIYLDCRKAQSLLGWSPQVDIEAGLARTVEFFRSRSAPPPGR